MTSTSPWSRRGFLRLTGSGLVTGAVLQIRPALALDGVVDVPERVRPFLIDAFGGWELQPGRVILEIPVIAETGLSVPVKFRVESPMTETDFAQRIMGFVPGNPEPVAADYLLTPRAGIAEVSSRIRVARTQTVLAAALMSDGSRWGASFDIMVTQGACFEENVFLADQLAAEERQRLRGEIP